MKRTNQILSLIVATLCLYSCEHTTAQTSTPNVLMIYTDDIGYGDIGCYGAQLIQTPNIDQLAQEGLRFTDAHCAASTCSPSRYALITGEMGFRKNVGIQPVNAAATIDSSQYTLGHLFQEAGYTTGIIGKWHLGLGDGNANWNKAIKPCPLDMGFDYNFILPSSNDRSPFVYLENRHVYNYDPNDPITVSMQPIPDSIPGTKYPDAINNPESVTVYTGDRDHQNTVINGVARIGYMKGGEKALWNDNNIAFDLREKAFSFFTKNKDKPFLLLLTTNDIHAPRLPHPQFRGSTSLGYRGDNIAQLDWFVGEITQKLKDLDLDQNTIIIFSSDNGPVLVDGGYLDGSKNSKGHKASGIYRGGKYSIYEGGNRIPFIVKWPGKIKPGTSNALFTQTDMLASFSEYFNINMPANAGPDSRNYWNTLIGKDTLGADMILEQVNTDAAIAIREGNLKYVYYRNRMDEMYNLSIDPSEKNNIISQYPEQAKDLEEKVKQLIVKHIND